MTASTTFTLEMNDLLSLFESFDRATDAAWAYDCQIGNDEIPPDLMLAKSRDLWVKANQAKIAFKAALLAQVNHLPIAVAALHAASSSIGFSEDNAVIARIDAALKQIGEPVADAEKSADLSIDAKFDALRAALA